MNWQNAKNLTLMSLVILNIFLSALVFANRENYSLNPAAERSIYKLLAENKMSLYDDIIKNYKPMKQLIMEPYAYDHDLWIKTFFRNPESVKVTLEYDKTIYKSGDETLIFQNENITYTSGAESGEVISREAAVEACNTFLKKQAAHLKNYAVDKCVSISGGYRVEYRQQYKGNLIYSNYLAFEVNSQGFDKVTCKYNNPLGFEGNQKEILSPDEALFILIKYVRKEYGGSEIFINTMDNVYLQTESSSNKNISLKALPYYRFYISDIESPILINSYTGDIIAV